MLALAETARFHEVALLRDALWNHIAGRTSLRVKIPVSIPDIPTTFLLIPDFMLTLFILD
jgi:hypothetical protein